MRHALTALLLAVAVHGVLALALAAYLTYAPEPEALATLDVSSVELSFAEREDASAPVMQAAVSAPVAPQVPLPHPPQAECPHEPTEDALPLPPEAEAARPQVDPVEARPQVDPAVPPPETQARPVQPETPPPVAPRQAKVEAPARPRRAVRPDYPKGARQRGEQGEVLLEIEVQADGTAGAVRVVRSCGFPELDAAAEKALRTARFVPARSDGKPVASVVRQTIQFRLK